MASLQDSLNNGRIPGAAADVPGDSLPYLLLRWIGFLLKECVGGHQDPWRAEAALKGVVFLKGPLQRM